MLRPSRNASLLWLSAGLLSACAHHAGTPDNEPTLRDLASRHPAVQTDAGATVSEKQAISAYRAFLEAAPKAPQASLALRRIGDLEMAQAEHQAGQGGTDPDYRAAIQRYQEFLRAYPHDPASDGVLYQLARAQEQGGDLTAALTTLDRLVTDFPQTPHRDEAQFRRGELLFASKRYADAEAAYTKVLGADPHGTFHDRALYMLGWSQFKQARLDEALEAFFGVLDTKLGESDSDGALETLDGLSRGDRELVLDTLRVVSLSLENLQGAESIPAHIRSPRREAYEFRIYEQLGELYIQQERVKDAADTFGAYARRRPLAASAPLLQARVIDLYEHNGFADRALQASQEFAQRYGPSSDFRRANPQGWGRVAPEIHTRLAELARHFHAAAQRSHAEADVDQAAHWYRTLLEGFPDDAQAPASRFLLAELLFENHRYAAARTEYEHAAYVDPRHARSADAGYAALLSLAQERRTAAASEQPALRRAGVASAQRFADAFGQDPRVGAVLADAADTLYALNDAAGAARVAQRVLELQPPAEAAARRVAWIVRGHTSFESGAFAQAEAAYAQALALIDAKDPVRSDLVERQAAAIYKQGEQARDAGQSRDAVAAFARVASVAPQSTVRAAAQFDAAAALIGLKDWDGAVRELLDFRQRFPGHALQAQVTVKLVAAYQGRGDDAGAAVELERVAATHPDPAVARDALWQAAESHEKAGHAAAATKVYERYLAQNPTPLPTAIEARARLARLAHAAGDRRRETALQRDILQADRDAGAARTERTRALGAQAALALAEPTLEAYRTVQLVEPLQKQLKLKKARMQDALQAYAAAAEYGVADVSTAATLHSAELYRDFGRALMASQRPKKLSKLELEQYNVMLEEQAYPFEEKAIELHQINTARAAKGIYDASVRASYDALRELLPVRYGKVERNDPGLSGTANAVEADAAGHVQRAAAQARAGHPAEAVSEYEAAQRLAPQRAAYLNELGIAYRQAGRFDDARQAYERAMALEPANAVVQLNLGILYDLYLGDVEHAKAQYERYLALTPQGDPVVTKWSAEISHRKPALAAGAAKEKA